MLKNGVGRYNIFFFYFYTKLAESSFLCHFRIESVNVFILPRFDLCHGHVHISFIDKQFRTCANAFPNELTVRSYEYSAGKHWMLYWMQRRISFVLGYLRMILWKSSTAISIKHRILATFNIKKYSILTACMPLNHKVEDTRAHLIK